MRYHIARDVLGVGLTIATAMAQGPATSSLVFGSDAGAYSGGGARSTDRLLQVERFDTGPSTLSTGQLSNGQLSNGQLSNGQLSNSLPLALQRELQDEDDQYTLHAQFRQHHGEFMDRREAYDPDLELRARAYPYQRVGGEPGHFDMIGYDLDAEFPMLVSTEGYLLFGFYQYGRHFVTSSNFGTGNGNTSAFGDETLTAAGLRLGFGVFLSNNVLFEAETNPGVWSDMDGGLHHNDLDFPSSALLTVETMDGFFFKVGARYNQIYKDAPWLPYLGFSWEIVEGFRIDVLLPEKVELSFWPTSSTSFSLGTMVQGAQYHVRAPGSFGSQRANVQLQEIIAYLGMTHRFTDSVSLACRAGMVVAGDYDLTTGAPDSTFNRIEGTLDPGVYADITFGIDW